MTHRRNFVASCGALVLALSGCQSLLSRTRLAHLALADPHPDDYEPVLGALIATILPFDHPRFPRVSAAELQERLPIAACAAQDRRLYLAWRRAFPSDATSFTALQPPARTAYFRLWGQSGFNSKALFYTSAKRLVMITAYSMRDFWRAIGYAGPLLKPS